MGASGCMHLFIETYMGKYSQRAYRHHQVVIRLLHTLLEQKTAQLSIFSTEVLFAVVHFLFSKSKSYII